MSITSSKHSSHATSLPDFRYRPIYAIEKSYDENALQGPFFEEPIPKREWSEEKQWKQLLGYPVASPLGVPAGPLLNSRWITLAANLGFDIVTYKTIRSYAQPSHPVPNIVYVKCGDVSSPSRLAIQTDHLPADISDLAITNSFGNPSKSPEFLQEDIQKARQSLKKGQVLIVSVFGTGNNVKDLAEDFARAAILAKEAGAHIIEANFSCPNLSKGEGSLYTDPQAALYIAKTIVQAISPLPLIIKVGPFPHRSLLQKVLVFLAKAGVQGICGLNSIPMQVNKPDKTPALAPNRPTSGVCGGPIQKAALEFVKSAKTIIEQEQLDLTLLGCGGITLPTDFDDFLKAGADAALTATGMMWDPYLAMRWHHSCL